MLTRRRWASAFRFVARDPVKPTNTLLIGSQTRPTPDRLRAAPACPARCARSPWAKRRGSRRARAGGARLHRRQGAGRVADRQVDRRVRGGRRGLLPPGRAQRHPRARRARRVPRQPPRSSRATPSAAVEAGAQALHVHPRGEDGRESLAPPRRRRGRRAARGASPTSSSRSPPACGSPAATSQRGSRHVRGWSELPDCCSLNVAEEGWRELGELLAERGVWIEAGLFAPRHPEQLAESGLARHCRRALVEPQETAPEIGGHHRRGDRRQPRAPRDRRSRSSTTAST